MQQPLSSTLGSENYANLQFVGASDGTEIPKNRYILCRYRIDEAGALEIWTISEAAAKRALSKGLAGELTSSGHLDSVLFTAKGPALGAYLQAADPADLFDNSIAKFRRLN